MWIVQLFPAWVLVLILLISLLSYAITNIKIISNTSITLIFLSIFMLGAIWNNEAWLKKVAVLEKKITELETKSSKENLKIVEKIITKRETVKEKSNAIVQYVDKEVVKYNSTCKIPDEVIEAINTAAYK